MAANDVLGVFDSGVGGISVLREIRRLLPYEDLLYVADSGNVPYGSKSEEWIRDRSLTIGAWLIKQGAKAIVIACNTATAAAAHTVRAAFDLPIVAMEPAIKPAVAATRSGIVGVLSTVGTARSERLTSLIERFGRGVQILTQPCPGLVECVEAGDLVGPSTRALLEGYTMPLLERGADTLVLGCTHYPFLRPLLRDIVGNDIVVIDTGAAVARRTRDVLGRHALLSPAGIGTEYFRTSGGVETARHVIGEYLWGAPVAVEALPI
jgi:glutamate racemase